MRKVGRQRVKEKVYLTPEYFLNKKKNGKLSLISSNWKMGENEGEKCHPYLSVYRMVQVAWCFILSPVRNGPGAPSALLPLLRESSICQVNVHF